VWLYSIGDYVTTLSRCGEKKFHMDVLRNDWVDVTVIHNDLEYEFPELKYDFNEINIVLLFRKNLPNRENCLANFIKSKVHQNNKSTFFIAKDLHERYIVTIKKDWDLLYKTLYEILYEVYEYSERDTYCVKFIDYNEHKPKIINHVYISWSEYFSKSTSRSKSTQN